MKELKDFFSYSVADEIMPDILNQKPKTPPSLFALILDSGETISKAEISEIKKTTGLFPLFIDISRDLGYKPIRLYARSLHASIIQPKSKYEFAHALQNCSFTVSESVAGGIFSLLSHTPSYLNAGNEDCRRLIGEVSRWNIKSEIIMPYTKNRTAAIHRPIAREYDFYLVKNKFRAEIGAKFKDILYD